MINRLPKTYRWPLFLAVLLHLIIFVLIFFRWQSHAYRLPGPTSISHAVMVQAIDLLPVEAYQPHRQTSSTQKKPRLKKHKVKSVLVERQKRREALLKKRRRLARKIAAEKKAAKKKLLDKQEALEKKILRHQMAKEEAMMKALHVRQMQGLVDQYKAKIIGAIQSNWYVPSGVSEHALCQFLIHVAPGGVVMDVTLLKSSGNTALDQSARLAIFKTSPLPVPKDASEFDPFRSLRLTVSPRLQT